MTVFPTLWPTIGTPLGLEFEANKRMSEEGPDLFRFTMVFVQRAHSSTACSHIPCAFGIVMAERGWIKTISGLKWATANGMSANAGTKKKSGAANVGAAAHTGSRDIDNHNHNHSYATLDCPLFSICCH